MRIGKGSIVKYKDGNYRVSACFKETLNLASIFGGKIYFRGVPISECVEDEKNWYDRWTQSETYKSM